MQEQEQTQVLEYFHQLANLLRAQGVPEEEIQRAILSQMEYPTPDALDFPGPVTGIDLAGNQPRLKVPDTGFPPVFIANPESSTDFIPSVGPEGYLSQDRLPARAGRVSLDRHGSAGVRQACVPGTSGAWP